MKLNSRFLQDVYIYGENSVTLLGTDYSRSNTYLAQLNLHFKPTKLLNDKIDVTYYSDQSQKSNKDDFQCKDDPLKSSKENILTIKAEKLVAKSVIKYLRKTKSDCFCVSSSRRVAAILSANRHRENEWKYLN